MRSRRGALVALWLGAAILGGLHAWDARYTMNADGISYLDVADAYARGDWPNAVSRYWSPFYSWLLALVFLVHRPPPYWESTVVHVVNFAVYLAALACFHFLLEGVRRHRAWRSRATANDDMPLLVIGYALFVWSALSLVTVSVVTPDLGLSAAVYLVAGIVLRIASGRATWAMFALLGGVIGAGYLMKAVMLPVGLVFLGAAALTLRRPRAAVLGGLVALAVFVVVAGPFVAAMSVRAGRLTFGDAGKLNYAWNVNITASSHWQGEPPSTGTPLHPTRRIGRAPDVFEFAAPIAGTYPVWYDPAYWFDGMSARFSAQRQAEALYRHARNYLQLLVDKQSALLAVLLLVLASGPRMRAWLEDVVASWMVVVPAAVALAMYAVIFVLERYVAPFVVLMWMTAFAAPTLNDAPPARRLLKAAAIALTAVTLLGLGAPTLDAARNVLRDVSGHRRDHKNWEIAEALRASGIRPGDSIAVIGDASDCYWARLAGARVVAEVPTREVKSFVEGDTSARDALLALLRSQAAVAIVTDQTSVHQRADGWTQLAGSRYYVHPSQATRR